MQVTSASEAKRRFKALLDAIQREPVTIRRQSHEVALALSPTDCRGGTVANVARFRRFCDRATESAAARGMTDKELAALLSG